VVFNPVAQAKFVHTVSAGYVCAASIFVLGVSAWYVLKGRHLELAKRSMTVAASFGLAGALSVVGARRRERLSLVRTPEDEARRDRGDVENGSPRRRPSPLIGFPDQQARETHYAIHIPWRDGAHRDALARRR
jgi:cytochrome d ubiquinol oxidase subunit I